MSEVARVGAHRRNCEQLGEHARAAGRVMEQLRAAEIARRLPAAEEPMLRLEAAVNRAVELVDTCTDKSFLYTLAMGWTVVYQFREAHDEIHRCFSLFPFVPLLTEFRMQSLKEELEAVEKDKREYTLDDEDLEAHRVILKPDRTKKDAEILEKLLSRLYPDLGFDDALQEEKEKLNIELQISRANDDPDQCRVIQHLIGVTENVVNVLRSKKVEKLLSNEPGYVISGYISNIDFGIENNHEVNAQWKADLFGCCSEPSLSLKTLFYPCGTFSWIANVVSEGKISREQAVNNIIAYSVIGGCFCYTCCFRKKLRQLFNIEGGSCDDFFTHLMCCCCAMVQERRELELRNFAGCQGRKMIPPPFQYMTS